jgi:PAS domain S-box-containing protein
MPETGKQARNKKQNAVISDDLASYLDILQESVLVTDLHGKFIFLNKQAILDFGKNLKNSKLLNWSSLYQIRDADILLPVENKDLPIVKVLSTGIETERNLCVETKKGENTFLKVHSRPRLAPDGTLIGSITTYTDITLEFVQKQKIKENEDQLATLLERIHEGVLQLDLTGKVLYVNDKFCSMLGYSRQYLLGLNIIEAVKLDGADAAKAKQRLKDSASNKAERYELTVKNYKGENRILEINSTPLKNKQGIVTSIFSIYNDITERRKSVDSLKKSEAQYRSLVEHMNEGLVLLDHQGNVSFANQKFSKLLGHRFEDIIGTSYADLVGIKELPKSNGNHRLQVKHHDGSLRWHNISFAKHQTAKDKPTGLMLIHSDISSEKKYAEERERLLVTADSTSDFVVIIGIDGVVLYVNKAGRKAIGVSMKMAASEIVMADYYTVNSLKKLYNEAVPQAIKNGTWQGEMQVVRKNRETIPISQVIICKRNSAGKVDYFTSIGRDITETRMPQEQTSPLMRIARNGTVAYANPASKLLLNEWKTKVGSKIPPNWRATINQVLRTNTSEEVEVTFKKKVFELKLVPVEEYDYVNLIGNDITVRKNAEEQLKASERKYRAVVEDQTELISRYLKDGKITFANAAYRRYFGYETEITGKNIFSLIPKSALAGFKQRLSKLTIENPSISYSHENKENGKPSRWQMWTDRAIYDEQGNFIEFQSVALDITVLKETEQQLRMQEVYLRQIIDSIPNLIFVRNAEGRYKLVNNAFANLLGTDINKLVGAKHNIVAKNFPLEKKYLEQDLHVIKMKQEAYFPEESVTRPSDKKQFWFSTIKKPLLSPDGKWQILGVSTDITQRKELEQSLQLQLKLRTLISIIATRFINLPFHQIDEAIRESLKNLGELNDIDRVVINLKAGELYKPTYYWLSDELSNLNFKLQTVAPFGYNTKEAKQMSKQGYVYYLRGNKIIPEDSVFRNFIEKTEIKSCIVLPLEAKGESIGIMALSSIRNEIVWDEDMISLLRITSQVISSALERKNTEALLNFTLQFQNIITIISANFISIAPKNIDAEITASLKYVAEFLDIDQSYIFMANSQSSQFKLTHYWIERDQEPNEPLLGMVEASKFVWVYRQVKKHGYFSITNSNSVPSEARELKEITNKSGIKSAIGIPIISKGVFKGLLIFASFQRERFWRNETIPLLKIMSQIVANALDRKRNEEEIAETRELYRTLARNIPKAAVFLYDRDLKYRLVEGAELEDQGYDKHSMEGRTLQQVLRPSVLKELEPLYKGALQGKEHIMEREFNKKHYLIHFLPVRNEKKDIYAGMVMSLDITDLKEIQRKLEHHTIELLRSNEDLELFAYAASHDLQEPLRMIGSYIHLIQRRLHNSLESDTLEFMAYATDGVKRMQELINDLLEYSRVDRKSNDYRLLNMNKTVEFVNINLKEIIAEKGAIITMEDLPDIYADQPQIISLLQNLLENAIKFHGDQPPKVHIGYKDNGDSYVFSVKDNGIGINDKFFDKIFLVFQRLHSLSEYSGSGIGLATCKKIVERHGGKLWVESQIGKGTTFYFSIIKKESTD